MPIDPQSLFEESKCYLCYGISTAQALELALLARIVENGGGAVWGGITGTIGDQTDLQTALAEASLNKFATLYNNTAGNAVAAGVLVDWTTGFTNSSADFTVNTATGQITAVTGGNLEVSFLLQTHSVAGGGKLFLVHFGGVSTGFGVQWYMDTGRGGDGFFIIPSVPAGTVITMVCNSAGTTAGKQFTVKKL